MDDDTDLRDTLVEQLSLHDEFELAIAGARDVGLTDETIEAIFNDCLNTNVAAGDA